MTRGLLTDIADQFRDWITIRSQKWGVPILEAPEGRRDKFLDPYFQRAKADEIVLILKAREPARILIANGNKKEDRWHLQITQRWVNQYGYFTRARSSDRGFYSPDRLAGGVQTSTGQEASWRGLLFGRWR